MPLERPRWGKRREFRTIVASQRLDVRLQRLCVFFEPLDEAKNVLRKPFPCLDSYRHLLDWHRGHRWRKDPVKESWLMKRRSALDDDVAVSLVDDVV